MLTFIGNGSAFNTKLGNNSAYYKEGDEMLLIDCGSNIFERILNHRLLDGVNHIHVIVTHTHADHVGSLADLILYMYYAHGEMATLKVTVHCCEGVDVYQLLSMNGVNTWLNEDHYYCQVVNPDSEFHLFSNLFCKFVETHHVEEIPSTGFFLTKGEHTIYYSGDTNELPEEALAKLSALRFMYVDTCKADYEGNVHLSLRKLADAIPHQYRNKVWCMHLDSTELYKEATELGFKVTRNLDTRQLCNKKV